MTSERRVHVLMDTAGGHGAGRGHVVRSRELARRLRRRGARISWLTARTSRKAPDVVVIDRDDVSSALIGARHRRWPGAAIVALDYYGPPAPGIAAVVNLNGARVSRWPRSRRPGLFAEGLAFATIRASFERLRRARPSPRGRVLVGFGGTDPTAWTVPALRALEPLAAGAAIDVLTGRPSASIARAVRRHRHARLHTAVADPAALLWRCSLAIIGGGTMAIEAACLGVPAIVIPRTWRERQFVREFARAGAARVVPWHTRFPAAAVAAAARRLLADAARRRGMRRAGRALVDGHGAERVAAIVMRAGRVEHPGHRR